MLHRIRQWLARRLDPQVATFEAAKRVHLSSEHWRVTDYESLTDGQKSSAAACPRLNAAYKLYLDVAKAQHELRRPFNEAAALYQLGLLTLSQGRDEEASQHFRGALTIAESLPDTDCQPLIRDCCYRLAQVAHAGRETAEALRMARRALDLAMEDQDPSARALIRDLYQRIAKISEQTS